MAKKTNDFVTAFIWACNILDTNNLSIAEQAVLFNLLKLINRNFWKPIKISAYKLARTMCSDKRTIEKAFKSLAEKKIIYIEEGEIYIGNISEEHFKNIIARPSGGNGGKISGENGDTDKPVNNSPANATESPRISDSDNTGIKTLADF